MSQLIGTASNQVPTNGDLGTAAFMDTSAFYSTGLSASYRNVLINGGMIVDQRASAATAVTINLVPGGAAIQYSVDRWKSYGYNATGNFDAVLTTQQYADHPINGANGKCLRTLVTTADTVASGTDFFVIRQDIEGFNSAHLYGKPLSLSFWVKTSTPGNYSAQLRAVGTTDGLASPNFIGTYKVSTANTWEYKTISIPAQTLSTVTCSVNSGYSLYMTLVSGQTELSSGGAGISECVNKWARYSSDGIASSTISNTLTAAVNNYFQFAEVQLEVGAAATPFEVRPFGIEEELCKRYFEKNFAAVTAYAHPIDVGVNAGYRTIWMPFSTTKRVSPTVVIGVGGTITPQPDSMSGDVTGFYAQWNGVGGGNFVGVTSWVANSEL